MLFFATLSQLIFNLRNLNKIIYGMSELMKYIHSLIRNADECDAAQASLQFDVGLWRARLSVQKRNGSVQEGGAA